MSIATATDYAQLQKEARKNALGVSEWERYFLQPLKANLESSVASVQKQVGYDISSAFANYQQQQRQLAQMSNLTSGFKDKLKEDLEAQYGSSVAAAQTQQSNNLSNIYGAFNTALQEEESRLQTEGTVYRDIEDKLLDYGVERGVITSTSLSDLQKEGYYELNPESGEYIITNKGQDLYRRLFNDTFNIDENTSDTFGDYLSEKDSKLYEKYARNSDIARYLIGGFSGSGDIGIGRYMENTAKFAHKNEAYDVYYNKMNESEQEKFSEALSNKDYATVIKMLGVYSTTPTKKIEKVKKKGTTINTSRL